MEDDVEEDHVEEDDEEGDNVDIAKDETLRGPAQSKCTLPCHQSHFIRKFTGKMPRPTGTHHAGPCGTRGTRDTRGETPTEMTFRSIPAEFLAVSKLCMFCMVSHGKPSIQYRYVYYSLEKLPRCH